MIAGAVVGGCKGPCSEDVHPEKEEGVFECSRLGH